MCTGIEELVGAIVGAIISVAETAAPALAVTSLVAEGVSLIACALGDPDLANFMGSISSVFGVGAGITGGLSAAASGLATLSSFSSSADDAASGLVQTSGATGITGLETASGLTQTVGGISEIALTCTGHGQAAGFANLASGLMGTVLGFAQGGVDVLGAVRSGVGVATATTSAGLAAAGYGHAASAIGVVGGGFGFATGDTDWGAAQQPVVGGVEFGLAPPEPTDAVDASWSGKWGNSISWDLGPSADEGMGLPTYVFEQNDAGEAVVGPDQISEIAPEPSWSDTLLDSIANRAFGTSIVANGPGVAPDGSLVAQLPGGGWAEYDPDTLALRATGDMSDDGSVSAELGQGPEDLLKHASAADETPATGFTTDRLERLDRNFDGGAPPAIGESDPSDGLRSAQRFLSVDASARPVQTDNELIPIPDSGNAQRYVDRETGAYVDYDVGTQDIPGRGILGIEVVDPGDVDTYDPTPPQESRAPTARQNVSGQAPAALLSAIAAQDWDDGASIYDAPPEVDADAWNDGLGIAEKPPSFAEGMELVQAAGPDYGDLGMGEHFAKVTGGIGEGLVGMVGSAKEMTEWAIGPLVNLAADDLIDIGRGPNDAAPLDVTLPPPPAFPWPSNKYPQLRSDPLAAGLADVNILNPAFHVPVAAKNAIDAAARGDDRAIGRTIPGFALGAGGIVGVFGAAGASVLGGEAAVGGEAGGVGAAGAPLRTFPNQLPQFLSDELAEAAAFGVKPRSGAGALADLAGQRIKWAVTQDGKLVVIPATPKLPNGQPAWGVELSHAVLSGGEPVLSAGEALLEITPSGLRGNFIKPYSGHFFNGMPTEAAQALPIGEAAFEALGIAFEQRLPVQ
jgi:hypothetical protein